MNVQMLRNESVALRTLAAAVAALVLPWAVSSAFAAPQKWAEGRILVQPRAGLSDAEFDQVLKGHGARSKRRVRELGVHVIDVAAQDEDKLVVALSRNPKIKFAERDALVPLEEILPDDPNFSSQWHLNKMQNPMAWDVSQGYGVTIAILDTGIDPNHPDLQGNLLPGWNAVSDSNDTSDINGHGTQVAGTAAAVMNNAMGVASIAPQAKLLPVRVTDSSDGYAYWSTIANALTWAADHGAKVANISYDCTSSAAVSSAAQYMRSKGGVVMVAAGNDGTNPGYADNPYVISVSATTSSDAKASWSNHGAYIDVAAPGADVWTTKKGGSYGSVNGTSFASPAAAGVAALIMAANPELVPAQVEQILKASAVDLVVGADFHDYFGWGRVNAEAAVQLAMQTPALDTTPPTVSIFDPAAGQTVQGSVTVNVNASDNVGVSRVELYAKNQLVGTDTTAPYGFAWDSTGVADGSAGLVAKAYDAAGNLATSATVTVSVDNVPDVADTIPPTVGFTNLAHGQTVTGATYTVQVSATDQGGSGLGFLKLYLDGVLKSTNMSGSMNYSLNVKKLSTGAHTLMAIAQDQAGNSNSVSITVYK